MNRTKKLRNEKKPHEEMQLGNEVFALERHELDDPSLINFYELESHQGSTFRWSEPVAMIRMRLPNVDHRVKLDTGNFRGADLNFQFQLHWNDYRIPAGQIRKRDGTIEFDVPASVSSHSGEQRLTITCKPLAAENGRRMLGLPLCSIRAFEIVRNSGPQLVRFDKHQFGGQKGRTKRRMNWFGSKTPEPVIPIWSVSLPAMRPAAEVSEVQQYPAVDRIVVSACEINSRHGTGLLIKYLIKDFDQIGTLNSIRCYNDERVSSKVHHCLPSQNMSRADIFDLVLSWYSGHPPREAYVVPYFKSDMLIAIALKDLFGTKVCLHVMDDNCLFDTEIPKEVAAEAIEKCDLVLAISPEMRQAYEQYFGKKIWLLPPIVPNDLIADELTALAVEPLQPPTGNWLRKVQAIVKQRLHKKKSKAANSSSKRGILIGNIWDRVWLDKLRGTIRESGLEVDWYSNNPDALWLEDSTKNLAQDGIFVHEPLWGQDLVDELRRRPFAIMPTSDLTGTETKESIARLSLPSRVPFMVATAQTPLIALGSVETAAARFIQRFDLGDVVEYKGDALREAVDSISEPARQVVIRQKALEISAGFGADSLGPWLWDSLEQGKPVDDRFEDLFPVKPGDFSCFFDPEPPKKIHWSFRDTWQMIDRIRHQGFVPENIIDVGASTGIWSWTASSIFPDAKFVLVDPMMSRYRKEERDFYCSKFREFEFVEAALSDHCGETELLISNDLYGSSLLKIDEKTRTVKKTRVDVMTLNEMAKRTKLAGKTLLKVDVQFAEHLVINGGLEFIRKNVDTIILELTIEREHPQAKTYREMLDLMDELGFVMIDEMEGWRDPVTGRLQQKDTVFVRRELLAIRQAA